MAHDETGAVVRRIRKGCSNRDIRDVCLAAVGAGARFRLTRRGIVFYGRDGGTAHTHWTVSDVRAAKNLRAALLRIGVPL